MPAFTTGTVLAVDGGITRLGRRSRAVAGVSRPPSCATRSWTDGRHVLMAVLDHDPGSTTDRRGLVIIADKGHVATELDAFLARPRRAAAAPVLPQPHQRCRSHRARADSR